MIYFIFLSINFSSLINAEEMEDQCADPELIEKDGIFCYDIYYYIHEPENTLLSQCRNFKISAIIQQDIDYMTTILIQRYGNFYERKLERERKSWEIYKRERADLFSAQFQGGSLSTLEYGWDEVRSVLDRRKSSSIQFDKFLDLEYQPASTIPKEYNTILQRIKKETQDFYNQ